MTSDLQGAATTANGTLFPRKSLATPMFLATLHIHMIHSSQFATKVNRKVIHGSSQIDGRASPLWC